MNKMGQSTSKRECLTDEIWLIDNGNFNKSTTLQEDKALVIDKEQTLEALLSTLTHIKDLLKDRKVYVAHRCNVDLIQPIVDYYNLTPVKAEEGIFNGLLALNSATLCSNTSSFECKSNSTYNNLQNRFKSQSYDKIKCNDDNEHGQDLIYLLLIGDIPVYPELQLNLEDNCRCGYYKDKTKENTSKVTLSGTVIRRSYLNMILKSFSNIGEPNVKLEHLSSFIYRASIGRRGLQPIIRYEYEYENRIKDSQKEIDLLQSRREKVTLFKNKNK